MAIIRFGQPFSGAFSEIDRLRREVDRVFNEMVGTTASRDYSGVFPPVNIYESEDYYLLTAELLGIDPADMEIAVTGDSLTIKGQRKPDDYGESASYHRRERDSGYFRRVLTLPDKVDPDKVEATNRHGILQIRLPKAEEIRPRQIHVKGSEG
jgi:HSP20 family protein